MLKKLIAPIIVTVLFVLYCGGYGLAVLLIPGMPGWIKLILGVIAIALCGTMIAMFVERYREIKSGDEDDLNQY